MVCLNGILGSLAHSCKNLTRGVPIGPSGAGQVMGGGGGGGGGR